MSQRNGRNIFSLWLHALLHGHTMSWLRVGGAFPSGKIRFCWECDQEAIERDLRARMGVRL